MAHLLFLLSCKDESTPELIPTRIALSPNQATVTEGDEQVFTASVYVQEDNVMPDQTENWSSSENAAATVKSQGVANTVSACESMISATISGLSGNATLSVLPLIIATRIEIVPTSITIPEGGEETFTATIFDQNDDEIENITVL